jgi:hypothetical protein
MTRENEAPLLIFNRVWKTWGAYDYEKNKGEDALQVTGKMVKASQPQELLTYAIGKNGETTLSWGDMQIAFNLK